MWKNEEEKKTHEELLIKLVGPETFKVFKDGAEEIAQKLSDSINKMTPVQFDKFMDRITKINLINKELQGKDMATLKGLIKALQVIDNVFPEALTTLTGEIVIKDKNGREIKKIREIKKDGK